MKKTENGAEIDYDKLKEIVHEAVHFLDNVIDVNQYPLPEIDKMTRGTRKIGLGVMGWADMLLQLGVAYDSDKANTLAEEVMGFIRREAQAKSMELAKVKGVFPYYDQSIFKKQKIKIRMPRPQPSLQPVPLVSSLGYPAVLNRCLPYPL